MYLSKDFYGNRRHRIFCATDGEKLEKNMSIPFRKFAAIISKVSSPTFSRERLHGVLISKNTLLPTTGATEITSLSDYKSKFGNSYTTDVEFVERYFSVINAKGQAPQKLVIARWANAAVAPFAMGTDSPASLSSITALDAGQITVTLSGSSYDITVTPTSATSLSDLASTIQTAIRANTAGGTKFTGATVVYNSNVARFIITGGSTGKDESINIVGKNTAGTALLNALGGFTMNQGADSETYKDAIDRIYQLNTSGVFFVNYDTTLTETEVTDAISWVQGTDENQSRYSQVCICILAEDSTAKNTITGYITAAGLDAGTGFWLIEKSAAPEAIGQRAAVNYDMPNAVTNVNFAECTFAQAITGYDNIVDYQNGNTNMSVTKDWDDKKFTYAYELGIGEQKTKVLGLGYEYGSFGTVMNQANEINLVRDIQMSWSNAAISLGNIYLHGASSDALLASIVQPCYNRAVANGTIARGPTTLLDEDKLVIMSLFGEDGESAIESVENNGYFYKFWPRTTADINNNQVRFSHAYQVGGSVNFLIGTSYIFK